MGGGAHRGSIHPIKRGVSKPGRQLPCMGLVLLERRDFHQDPPDLMERTFNRMLPAPG